MIKFFKSFWTRHVGIDRQQTIEPTMTLIIIINSLLQIYIIQCIAIVKLGPT